MIFYQFKSNHKYAESEKILTKYLLPVYQKFSNNNQIFKKYPDLKIESRIKVCTMKIMKSLEEAEILSKNEKLDNYEREKFIDELELEKIDLDYNIIHSEILENIIIKEDDSGISDLDIDNEEKSKSNIFQIQKIKKMIHKSVQELFPEFQENDKSKFLIKKSIDINDNNNKLNEKLNNKEKIYEKNEDIKSIDNFSTDICIEKEKKIINFKKYNYTNDPYSNFNNNNLNRNYEIKRIPKKRLRDNHSLLKEFNFKLIKKENINKKIFRKFRNFIKVYYNENKNNSIFKNNDIFWKDFSSKNLLPPMKIESNNGMITEYKSFNNEYLIWLFEQKGTTELFQLFINKEKNYIINQLIIDYNLDNINGKDIIDKLNKYLNFIPEIYSHKDNLTIKEEKELFNERKEDNKLNGENVKEKNRKLNLMDKKYFMEPTIDDKNNNFYFRTLHLRE